MLSRTIAVITTATGLMLGTVAVASAATSKTKLSSGASTSVPSQTTRTLCGSNQHMIAHSHVAVTRTKKTGIKKKHSISYTGIRYEIRNAYWLGQRRQCISNRGRLTNFTVVQRPGYDRAGHVVAFPDIFRGCIWHICSPKARLPARVSSINRPKVTWHTREGKPGTYNAAFDIWFGKKRMITGQATGAELMIWLDEHGGCCALQQGAPKVRVDGRRFWLSHWVTHHGGKSWNYIQFRMIRRTWRVNNLRLRPFIRRIEHLGLVKSHWWLENIEAGFELWSGGRGLQTTKFRVTM